MIQRFRRFLYFGQPLYVCFLPDIKQSLFINIPTYHYKHIYIYMCVCVCVCVFVCIYNMYIYIYIYIYIYGMNPFIFPAIN